MDFIEIIKKRRSIRRFKSDELTDEQINTLKDAIKYAPSAGNLQARFFHVIKNQDLKEGLVEAASNQKFIAQAPVVFVGSAHLDRVTHYGDRGLTLYCLQDVAASVQNLMLTACSMGLGSCWVGAFDEKQASKVLNLPEHLRPIAIVPVGYFDNNPSEPKFLPDEKLFEEL